MQGRTYMWDNCPATKAEDGFHCGDGEFVLRKEYRIKMMRRFRTAIQRGHVPQGKRERVKKKILATHQ